MEDAIAIGIVDGYFQRTAAVWHKEILFALSSGVTVFGSSSMGALRAAECSHFGMVPVWKIAWDFLVGERNDDADVAVLHGPAEFGYPLFSELAVIYEPTLAKLERLGLLTSDDQLQVLAAAKSTPYWEVSIDTLFACFGMHAGEYAAAYRRHRLDQKREDARDLVRALLDAPVHRQPTPSWQLRSLPTCRLITAN
ncbi:MAG: TfuA domain-containing protein [Candidatus Devosia euplotis]|nr:TfuA domain-containing protein [Candidatus Devosia euplotis]